MENLWKQRGRWTRPPSPGWQNIPMELSEDEYFLLGDNRESSEDSRFSSIGNVKRDQLMGKVWFEDLEPFSQFGPVRI